MSRRWALLAALGCGSPEAVDSETTGSTTTPVGTAAGTASTAPGVVCTVRDNALIFDCVATLPTDGVSSAFLEDPDGALRALVSEQSGTRLDFVLWRLHPETTYTVRVRPETGVELQAVVRTDAVPSAHAVAPVVSGSPTWEALLVPHECNGGANLLLIDPTGEVLWYLPVTDGLTGGGFTSVDGFQATSDNTVLAVVGRSRVREWTWTQALVLDLGWPGALPGPVHHDVARHDGHTYVITAAVTPGSDGLDYVMDGVLIFDAAEILVAQWSLADVYAPSGGVLAPGGFWGSTFPEAWDWAHSNGIYVEPDGDWLISSRIHHTVLRVQGDWAAPDFGTVQWALSFDPTSALGSDFGFSGPLVPGDFQGQHHPSRDRQGRLMLFDNRSTPGESSRATVWDLDEVGRNASLALAWDLGEHCPVQGSVFQVPGSDHVVASCASTQTVYEFAPGDVQPVSSIRIPCAASGTRPLLVRAQPLAFADPL